VPESRKMIKAFYPLLLAPMLGLGVYTMPTEDPSKTPVQTLQNVGLSASASTPVLKRANHFIQNAAVDERPLASGTPSDFDSAHVEWCLERYRSYNPRDNTWVSYSGRVRQCDGPF
ncbi:MAG: BA14K family protein, partial [bacterium]